MSDDQTTQEVTDEKETATPENEQVEETTETSEEVEPESTEESTDETEETGKTTEQTSSEQPDYKQKFVESSRESILNAERVKVKDAQIESLTKQDTPTDEFMRQAYPDWDDFNEVTQKALIKTEAQELRQRRIEAQLSELREEKKLQSELESVISSNPKLAGKEAEFKRFAQNPKNKGISADVLAKAFLFDVEDETPPIVEKTEALPTGNGGPRDSLKPKKVSLEDAAKLRETDYRKYLELVKNNQIEDID